MKTLRAVLVVGLALCLPRPSVADNDEVAAVKAIEKMQGTAYRDDKQSGNPVVRIFLSGSLVTDVGLKELAGLGQLKTVVLSETPKVTSAGLKNLAACKQLQVLNING